MRIKGRLFSDYGIIGVLLILCAFFSVLTNSQHRPSGRAAARQVLAEIQTANLPKRVLIIHGATTDDVEFTRSLRVELELVQIDVKIAEGTPIDVRRQLKSLEQAQTSIDVIACPAEIAAWSLLTELDRDFPGLNSPRVLTAGSYSWPVFLTGSNLLNIANQISVIAIVAIGMTMVIIAGGIDLSVGSLIALSAVVTGIVIRDWAGATQAHAWGMVAAGAAGILVCGCLGLVTGMLLTRFRIPPFIVTLGTMMMASGVASKLTNNESVYQIPDSFTWLGRGATAGLPNSVLLMLTLYAAAWVVMSRTVLGRHLYAVGGNRSAAHLSAVPVKRVIIITYVVSGALAGLGGVLMASNLKSASPSYGAMYEMYVIAAVVVGGTSLSGGEGKILGTLLGALVIAVISNGMNLLNVESNMQRVVLGGLILGAVLLDCLQRFGWRQEGH